MNEQFKFNDMPCDISIQVDGTIAPGWLREWKGHAIFMNEDNYRTAKARTRRKEDQNGVEVEGIACLDGKTQLAFGKALICGWDDSNFIIYFKGNGALYAK